MAHQRRSVYSVENELSLSRLILTQGLDLVGGVLNIKTPDRATDLTHAALALQGGLVVGRNSIIQEELTVNAVNGAQSTFGLSNVPSTIAFNSQVSSDFTPVTDSSFNLGADSLRWQSISVNNVTNISDINVTSVGGNVNINSPGSVNTTNLVTHQQLNVIDDAVFHTNLAVLGHSSLSTTAIDTSLGSFTVMGGGDFIVRAPAVDFLCESFTLNGISTVSGIKIATEQDSIPFEFGSSDSTCTFNGKFVLVRGDLEVLGTTTSIHSQSVQIRDKNIELGVLDTPGFESSRITATGGGITLKASPDGSADKTITWLSSEDDSNDTLSTDKKDVWISNDNFELADSKVFRADAIMGKSAGSGLSILDHAATILTVREGNVGINTNTPIVSLQINSSDAVQVPAGGTMYRPDSTIAQAGQVRFNTDKHQLEVYTSAGGGVWNNLQELSSYDELTKITVEDDANQNDVNKIRFFTAGTEIANFDESGRLGLGTLSPSVICQIVGTDALQIPVGSSDQRPDSSIVQPGMIRFNQTLLCFEGYSPAGNTWSSLGGVISHDRQTYLTVETDDPAVDADKIRFFTHGTETMDLDNQGRLGLGTVDPQVKLHIVGTDAMLVPAGSNSQRPDANTALPGMVRYNVEYKSFEGYSDATDAWICLNGVTSHDRKTFISVEDDTDQTDVNKIRFFTAGTEIANFDENGRLGIGTVIPTIALQVISTDAIQVPVGDTSQRPDSNIVQPGMIRYNTELYAYEGYSAAGSVWSSLGGVMSHDRQTYITPETDDPAVDANKLRFFTAGTEIANFDENGRLGIGTSSPTVLLQVVGTDAIQIPVGSSAERPSNAVVQPGMIRFNNELFAFEGYNSAGNVWSSMGGVMSHDRQTYITPETDDPAVDANKLRFFTAGTEIANFDENGRLGIGTTTPTILLQVVGTDAIQIPVGNTAQRPDSSIVQPGQIRYNMDLFAYEGYSPAGSTWSSLGGVVSHDRATYITPETDDPAVDANKLRFFTVGTESMDLDSHGRLGLGVNDPIVQLQVIGTDAVMISAGSTTQRPDSSIAAPGMIRYNIDLHRYEGFGFNNTWTNLQGPMDSSQTTYISVLDDDLITDAGRIRLFVQGTESAILSETGFLGLNILQPRSRLSVGGSAMIGQDYVDSPLISAPDNGLIVQGAAGFGFPATIDFSPVSTLDIYGNVTIGTGYAGTYSAQPDGLIVQGNVSIGTFVASPGTLSTLSVAGNMSVGSTFAGIVAPDNSLIVEGNFAVGTQGSVVSVFLNTTDAIRIPSGDVTARPSDQDVAMLRYSESRNRFEGCQFIGDSNTGQQQWVATGVSNSDDTAFISCYNPVDGSSLDEIRFVTSATYLQGGALGTGYAGKFDSNGYFGLGGGSDRPLGSPLDILNTSPEQVALRFDNDNYMTFSVDQHGGAKIQSYSSIADTYGDINLVPAGPTRQIIVGDSTTVFGSSIPTKMSVYGYIYAAEGVKFADGTVQTSSSQGNAGGDLYGQWYLGDLTANSKKYYLPSNTDQVVIGNQLPLAKLSVCRDGADVANLPLLELRNDNNNFATLDVDSTGTLRIQPGLGLDSDCLLQPTGNVGVRVDSALASLHIDNDIFCQANSQDPNTTTGLGLYMRYVGTDSTSFGLISAGRNSTGSVSPLVINASQVTFSSLSAGLGLHTSTPSGTLSVQGNVAIGQTYASTFAPSASGLIVEGNTAIGTQLAQARLEVTDNHCSLTTILRVAQDNANPYGFVISNLNASTVVSDGLRAYVDNAGRSFVDSMQGTNSKHLVLQGSGGNVGIGCQNPSSVVEVDANAPVITLKDTGNTTASSLCMQDNSGASLASIVTQQDSTPGKGVLIFNTNKGGSVTETLRVNSSGRVGVSNQTPDSKLAITSTSEPCISFNQQNSAGAVMKIVGYSAAGSLNNNLVVNNAQVQAARIQGFASVDVNNSGFDGLPNGRYMIPLYTLT